MAHPVRLVVADDVRHTRPSVAFRLLLALPHLVVAGLCAIAVVALALLHWPYLVVRGRAFGPIWSVSAWCLRYVVAVSGYVLLLRRPSPSLRRRSHAVALELDGPSPQSRVKVLLRPLLALPAIVFASVLVLVAATVAVAAWFAAVASTRVPPGLAELGNYCLRFASQSVAYALLLTGTSPSLAGGAEGGVVTAASGSV